ncbi:MAG: CsgG/HfaB family protein [Pseudomonadota bacterium]|nr:CsgG/HfaB family protein [Pseudomonadota bacterium]
MKRLIVLLLTVLILSLLFQTVSSAADFRKTKIAVLDFQLQGEGFETKDMGIIVAEWFITALVKAGRFEVIERGLIQKLLEEQKLSMTGIVDASTATQIG